MTLVNKMIAEDLDRSATDYVYNQQQGLPVYYVRYTNHGSGRYYHAPAAVQYVVEAATPVAHGVTETNPLLHPYAIANGVPNHQGIANYGNEQSLERQVAGDLYHVDGKITEEDDVGEEEKEKDKEKEEEEDGDGQEEEDEEEDDVDDGEIHDGSGGSMKLFGYGGYEDEEVGEVSSGDESGSFESEKGERYSEHGGKGEKGYEAWKEFSKGGRGSNNDERREGKFF